MNWPKHLPHWHSLPWQDRVELVIGLAMAAGWLLLQPGPLKEHSPMAGGTNHIGKVTVDSITGCSGFDCSVHVVIDSSVIHACGTQRYHAGGTHVDTLGLLCTGGTIDSIREIKTNWQIDTCVSGMGSKATADSVITGARKNGHVSYLVEQPIDTGGGMPTYFAATACYYKTP